MHSLIATIFFLCWPLATTANADNPIAEYCPSDTNYTRGSAFQANLDVLLSSLPETSAAASTGFATNTTGASPDQAYGLAQCRADFISSPGCRTCLDGSAQDMAASRCAGQKKAMLIYDNCLLRISNESFLGAVDMSPVTCLCNTQNATQPERFTPRLGALMSNLTEKAAYGSPRMFAVGSAAVTPFVNIYGMAQCTRDLTADDCNLCVVNAVSSPPPFL